VCLCIYQAQPTPNLAGMDSNGISGVVSSSEAAVEKYSFASSMRSCNKRRLPNSCQTLNWKGSIESASLKFSRIIIIANNYLVGYSVV